MDYADLSDRDFRRFSNLVYEKCGINLHNGKKALVHTRLGKRLRDGGFRDFDDYYRCCRNVMIYFDKKTQERLVNKFHDVLVDGGYLFIGHSESLTGVDHPLRYIVPTVYKKG